MRRISMADPHFSAADREWIHREVDAILSGALSMGPNVRAFEQEFAQRMRVRHAIALPTCTAALEVALLAHGVSGGEVIVPAQTFVATGMAVHLSGATPVFAEVAADTLCLDLEDLRRRVTAQTRAVILVHMAGYVTADIAEFRAFCNSRGLALIEDAAHAPGAERAGRCAGGFGHSGCFSFYPTKVMTSAEGGMLVTEDDDIAAFARSMQHRGRDMHSDVEQYVLPGRNLRMTEMAALLGRVQLSHLDEFLERRRRIAHLYRQELEQAPGMELIVPAEPAASAYWKVPVLLRDAAARLPVTRRMQEQGVAVDWAYQPALHLQPVMRKLFNTAPGMLPQSEQLLARHICLPCHPRMDDDDALYVARTFRQCVGELQGCA